MIKIFTKIKSLFVLNILWLVCSLPIITVGASTTAVFYVSMKHYRGEDTDVVKDFFKSFKQNLVQATSLWFIIAVVGAAVLFIFSKAFAMTGNFSRLAGVLAAVLVLMYVISIIYIFPILARYDNSIFMTVRLSIAVAAVNFGTTTIIIVLWVIVLLSVYFIPPVAAFWFIFGNILIADYTAKNCAEIFSSVNNKSDNDKKADVQ